MFFLNYKFATNAFVVFSSISVLTQNAKAFNVGDHKLITKIAIEELQECNLLPPVMSLQTRRGRSAKDIVVRANAREDNYFINGIKKTFKYSHFYNPLLPLKQEKRRKHHANVAVADYTDELITIAKEGQDFASKIEILKNVGMIVHLVQDASSPAHLLWINHGPSDGFEMGVDMKKKHLLPLKPACSEIALAGLTTPLEIMKAAGLGTFKQLQEPVSFKVRTGKDTEFQNIQLPWSQSFYSRPELFTRTVIDFLKSYNLKSPNLNTPSVDDSGVEGWDKQFLPRGTYSFISDKALSPTLLGDNFGDKNFKIDEKTIVVAPSEYTRLKTILMRESILNTQRVILWLSTLNIVYTP